MDRAMSPPHADLLEHGAIGLADDDQIIPLALLERGLLLGEMILPRACGEDPLLQEDGIVRDGVETLRAGWPRPWPVNFSLSISF